MNMQYKFQQSSFMNPVVLQVINRMVDIPAACRSWYAQCTLCSRLWTLTGTVLGMVVMRLLLCNDRCPGWGAQKTVEFCSCRSWGSRNAWFDYGYMFCIIQGGFWRIFHAFPREGVDSDPEVCSPSCRHVVDTGSGMLISGFAVLTHLALCSHDCRQFAD